jgi:hypothetical protein
MAGRRGVAGCAGSGDLLGGRPNLGPNALDHVASILATLHGTRGCDDIDTVMRAVDAANAYLIGAIRRGTTELRANRSTGMDEREWQRAVGPYLNRMPATGRYPTLARAVHDGTHDNPDTRFDTGLDYLLDGIAARLPGNPRRPAGRRPHARAAPTGDRQKHVVELSALLGVENVAPAPSQGHQRPGRAARRPSSAQARGDAGRTKKSTTGGQPCNRTRSPRF